MPDDIEELIKENENIKNLQEREPKYVMPKLTTRNTEKGIKNNIPVKEEKRSINSGITLDEEKEL